MSEEVETPVEDAAPQVIATFTSHPIQQLRMADWQFEKGVLTFKEGEEESLEAFTKFLDSLPPIERSRVKKIDVEAAEKLIEELKSQEGGATQKIDSTVGERVTKPKPVGNLGSTLGLGNK